MAYVSDLFNQTVSTKVLANLLISDEGTALQGYHKVP